MRTFILSAGFLALLGCGGETGPLPNNPMIPMTPNNPGPMPGCEPCAAGLIAETDPCPSTLDMCINPANETLEEDITCFQADGRCYADALTRSGACHRSCGDVEQANVEECTGICFTDRANCAVSTLRRVDLCLDFARTQPEADVCTSQGVEDFGACDQVAVNCAETCKRVHRDG